MDIRMATQTIRDVVDMNQILDFYGYQAKHGFINCPFHPGDRNASLKVYKGAKGWHCFGCGKGGSVIDFVMEHEGCDFRTAVIAIDNAFSLGLLYEKVNPFKEDKERQMQNVLDMYESTLLEWIDDIIRLNRWKLDAEYQHLMVLESNRELDPQLLTAHDWTFIDTWKSRAEDLEIRASMAEKIRGEVVEWRRMHRRTKAKSA